MEEVELKVENLKGYPLLRTAVSVCPECFKEIEAKIYEIKGQAIMKKTCVDHGEFEGIVERNVEIYKKALKSTSIPEPEDLRTLVIPITYRCNLKCKFCFMPDDGRPDLTIKDVKSIIDSTPCEFISFSGGEPTLNPNLEEYVKYAISKKKKAGIMTNGVRISSEKYLSRLKDAGILYVFLSFNAKDDDVLEKIDRKRIVKIKERSFENLKKLKIPIVLSFSWLKGTNEGELHKLLKMALENSEDVIELRSRTYAEVGREAKKETTTLSEFLELYSEVIGIDVDKIIDYAQREKFFHQSRCRFDYFGLVFDQKNKNKIKQINNWYKLFKKQFGSKKAMKIVSDKLFGKHKLNMEVDLAIWPDKRNIDLDIVKCHTVKHYALDGTENEIMKTLVKNDGIRKKESEGMKQPIFRSNKNS